MSVTYGINIGSVASASPVTLQNAASATGAGTAMPVNGGVAVLAVSGTFTATITVQGVGPDGNMYTLTDIRNRSAGGIQSTITAPGLYEVNCRGLTSIYANITSYTSGNVTVKGTWQALPSADNSLQLTGSIFAEPPLTWTPAYAPYNLSAALNTTAAGANFAANTSYSFVVTGVTNNFESTQSNEVSITQGATPYEVVLSFTIAPNIDHIKIYQATGTGNLYLINTIAVSTVSSSTQSGTYTVTGSETIGTTSPQTGQIQTLQINRFWTKGLVATKRCITFLGATSPYNLTCANVSAEIFGIAVRLSSSLVGYEQADTVPNDSNRVVLFNWGDNDTMIDGNFYPYMNTPFMYDSVNLLFYHENSPTSGIVGILPFSILGA